MSIQSNFPALKPSLLLDFANTKQLDPRITFTRASTATFYDGVTTAKAEQNLLIRSQEFDDSAWQKTGITATGNNTTAPDGTTTAELLAETADTSTHQLSGSAGNNRHTTTSGLTYAFSVFLKKGAGATAPDIVQVSWGGAGFASDVYVNFNLSTGAVATAGAGVLSSAITSAGGGWYRCSFTATSNASGATSTAVFFTNNNGSAIRAPSYAGATTADVYAWGAQLEQRSAVTDYTATTTQPITNYIPVLQTAAAGQARFDHNPTTGEALGLLIEEQRTNLLTYSEEFDNAAWTKTRSSITANTIVAPDGTLTGDKLVEDTTATNTHLVRQTFSYTSGTTYTYSIYAKAESPNRGLQLYTTASIFGTNGAHNFNLQTGVASQVQAGGVTSYGMTPVGNGWYRCWVTAQATATVSSSIEHRLLDTSVPTSVYTGDGYSGIYIWGAQLEVGAFPTSYIPTVASQVTRSADAASMTGTNFSSWYRQDEGTLFAEGSFGRGSGIFGVDDTTNNNRMRIGHTGTTAVAFVSVVNNSTQFNTTSAANSLPLNTVGKMAMAYKVNDYQGALNGASVFTNTSAIVPTVTQATIGTAQSFNTINGHIRKIAYYPLRLSSVNLQALTS